MEENKGPHTSTHTNTLRWKDRKSNDQDKEGR